ncbi:MAG: hypothetical protein ACP5OA_02520 [Candidatus Woesearchaeota archaeon]
MKNRDKKVENKVQNQIENNPEHKVKNNIEHKNSIDKNTIFGIAAILAIFFIVLITISLTSNTTLNQDNIGQATQIIYDEYSRGYSAGVDVALCKIIAGLTTVYDDATLAVTLDEGSSTTYAGEIITVKMINDNGCIVSVGETSDYLALGQIQRLGHVYVTVKDVVN